MKQRRLYDYAIRRFVGGICVEEVLTQPLTRRLAMKYCRSECERIRNHARRRDSVLQVVLLQAESWGHRQEVVVAAYAWRNATVVRL